VTWKFQFYIFCCWFVSILKYFTVLFRRPTAIPMVSIYLSHGLIPIEIGNDACGVPTFIDFINLKSTMSHNWIWPSSDPEINIFESRVIFRHVIIPEWDLNVVKHYLVTIGFFKSQILMFVSSPPDTKYFWSLS